MPIPAADLNDAQEVAPVIPHGGLASAGPPLYDVAVVPDGVARVQWHFISPNRHQTRVQDAHVGHNLAYAPRPTGPIALDRATWFAADGTVIPTSDSALRGAITAQQNSRRSQLINLYARYSYHAPAALLSKFAVFSITGRTGVRTATGLIISRPRLSDVPYAIVNFSDPREPAQLDPSQIRQVILPSGTRVWVIPGQRGICIAALDRPQFPNHASALAGGASEGCSANLAQGEGAGVGFTSFQAGDLATTYQILPNSRPTITPRNGPQHGKTIIPPYGIYVGTS